MRPMCVDLRTELMKKKIYGTEGDDHQAWLDHIGLMNCMIATMRLKASIIWSTHFTESPK